MRTRYQIALLTALLAIAPKMARCQTISPVISEYQGHADGSFQIRNGVLTPVTGRPSALFGIPFDRPVIGYGGHTIDTLRLWAAGAPDSFDFAEFSHGDFVGAVTETLAAESITRAPSSKPA